MRLIDADKLIQATHDEWDEVIVWDESGATTADEFERLVDETPTVDTVERKKGKWIRNSNGTYSCSLCQSWIPNEQRYYANYCLFCGADMRGKNETN